MAGKPAGLGQIKKGFCFDEAGDEAFALGWPHLRRLTDEPVDPYRIAAQRLMDTDFDLAIHWPRDLATALVHAWGVGQLFDVAPGSREFRLAAQEALWNTNAPTATQVRDYIAERMLRSPMWASERATESFVLMLEALTSAEVVVEAVLEQLEAMTGDELHQPAVQPAWITFQLGYLLLRVDEARARVYRERMSTLVTFNAGVAEGSDVRVGAHPSHVRSLLLVLEGARAADRYTDKDLRWYTHAAADAQAVRMRATINRGYALPDARLVWIGGAEVLSTRLIRRWKQLEPRDQRWFFEAIAPVRDPGIVALVAALHRHGTGVRGGTLEWLLRHRKYAQPILAELADTDEDARAALEMI